MSFVFVIVLSAAALFTALVRQVRHGHYARLYTMGKLTKEVPSGWVIVLPLVQKLEQIPTDTRDSNKAVNQ